MRYTYRTPYAKLSPNLKAIIDADNTIPAEAWNKGDRLELIEEYFAHLKGLRLSSEEYDLLACINMHTISEWFWENENGIIHN